MNNAEIASTLNRFRKQGDLHRYERRVNKLGHDQKLKLVENLLAGDDPDEALRSAKQQFFSDADNPNSCPSELSERAHELGITEDDWKANQRAVEAERDARYEANSF